jgi:hypothetical protein
VAYGSPVQRRTGGAIAAVVLPPLALAIAGSVHPADLTAADALLWRNIHLVALWLFPLLGLAPWLVLREAHPRLAVVAAVLGGVYAVGYTALDVLAGIGAGALRLAGLQGEGVLFGLADAIAQPAVIAYLVASALAALATVATRRPVAVLGAVLVVAGAVSFLTSHIFPPRGVVTMLVLAAGWALLVAVRHRPRAG